MPRDPYPATSLEIQNWTPESIDEIVGNKTAVAYFVRALLAYGVIPATLLLGLSRSGKTALVKLFVSILFCERTSPTSRGPCLQCNACLGKIARYGEEGIYSLLRHDPKMNDRMMQYIPFDCSLATEPIIRALIAKHDHPGITITYLDEVHRLSKRHYDEMFLKALDEKNVVWIASSTTTDELEKPFLNRFYVHLRTELPTLEEMVVWLAERCRQFQLKYDSQDTLIALARRSKLVPGMTLHLLALAALADDRTMTMAMLDSQTLDIQ